MCLRIELVAGALACFCGCAAPSLRDASPADAAWNELSPLYEATARRIIDQTMADNQAWAKMEELCDGIGHRLTGSKELEQAIDWAVETMKKDGQENVRAEPVEVVRWVRGDESLTMISPRTYPMPVLALGGSVGTSAEGITAPVLVVEDEESLEKAADAARGRIVLFNNPMPAYDSEKGSGYGTAVRFRHKGAQLAAAQGAVACLVRSVTARSLRSPHTGGMSYEDAEAEIPAAAITTEDAAMISRLAHRGVEVTLSLLLTAREVGKVQSANVVAELRGRELPDEVVVMGGHIDSWDVGQGAHDDAAGCVMAMEAINVLRRMGLRPRRTIRVVLWTNEEHGLAGGKEYAKRHAEEMANHVAAIESDSGAFRPEGFSVECSDPARQELAAAQLGAILRLAASLGATSVSTGHSGADIGPMKDAGVVLMGLDVEGSTYFDYHHSHADTLDKVDPRQLSQCVAALAATSYVLADMPCRLGEAVPR